MDDWGEIDSKGAGSQFGKKPASKHSKFDDDDDDMFDNVLDAMEAKRGVESTKQKNEEKKRPHTAAAPKNELWGFDDDFGKTGDELDDLDEVTGRTGPFNAGG